MSEELAKQFHYLYEKLAPEYNYKTRGGTAVKWEDMPENNKQLMIEVCGKLLAQYQKDRGLLKEFMKDMDKAYESEYGTDHIMAVISQHYNIIKRYLR